MTGHWRKRVLTGTLAMSLLATGIFPSTEAYANAAPDGKTAAETLAQTLNKTGDWNTWKTAWETVRTDWTQISLTPGADASQLNFAWYSDAAVTEAPKLKIGKKQDLTDAEEYTAVQTDVKDVNKQNLVNTAAENKTYKSNKVTVKNLEPDTTYYYSYEKDGEWTEPEKYKTENTDSFSFIFVGDPQIGSSNEEKAKKPEDIAKESFKTAQSESVCSDSFNWDMTLEKAYAKTGEKASFVLSAGDQIQTNAKKVKDYTVSEVEYSGYLSPEILKSLPVATSVGNHDADNPNYTYHFHTPNNSSLGSNNIVGGDYYFTYGDALFIMLNTQDTEVEEHKQFIKETVKANPDSKWKIVTLHQDIYGSAEHSNEPEIANLRYELVPAFEENDIDVVLSGHDHAYSRSKMMLTALKSFTYTDDAFDEMLEKDLDAGENPAGLTTAPGNILTDTTDDLEKAYLGYLDSIMDTGFVENIATVNDTVVNPQGILYVTANSASGSKFYDLVPREQSYIASRWQGDAPTYSVVEIDDSTFKLNTYRTDTDEKIDTFTIRKGQQSTDSGNTSGSITPVTPGTSTENGQTKPEKPAAEEKPVEEEKPTVPEKGTSVKDKSGASYKVTKADAKNGTVQFTKVADKEAKKVTVPSVVKVDGVSYKVTSVNTNAFRSCKNLQTVVIGANVTKISANAFSGCSKLKSIVIKSTKLTSKNLSKTAFKGISSSTIIRVPKSKVKDYQKLFVKQGLSKQVKVKAI
ncbi:MAG: metallophosphoesterase [Agathobacter sp.]